MSPAGRNRRQAATRTDTDWTAFEEPFVVTAVAPHPRRQGRLVLEINRVSVGTMAIDLAADLGLRPVLSVDRPTLDAIAQAVRRTALLDKALDLLAVRARSTRDLRLRLRRAGGTEADLGWVVDRLTSQGFLDDAAYARSVAHARIVSGGVSRRGVESELRRRGVAADTAADAIGDTLEDVQLDEYGAALEGARRRVRALSSLDHATRRRRLYAWLARRGYEPDVVARVVREVLGREEGNGGE